MNSLRISALAVRKATRRIRHLVAAFGFLFAVGASSAQVSGNKQPLPGAVSSALRSAAIPAGSSGVAILPLSPGGFVVEANAGVPMNPASTMKLVTTYAALICSDRLTLGAPKSSPPARCGAMSSTATS